MTETKRLAQGHRVHATTAEGGDEFAEHDRDRAFLFSLNSLGSSQEVGEGPLRFKIAPNWTLASLKP